MLGSVMDIDDNLSYFSHSHNILFINFNLVALLNMEEVAISFKEYISFKIYPCTPEIYWTILHSLCISKAYCIQMRRIWYVGEMDQSSNHTITFRAALTFSKNGISQKNAFLHNLLFWMLRKTEHICSRSAQLLQHCNKNNCLEKLLWKKYDKLGFF